MSVAGHVLLPLLSATLYALGALWLKGALRRGVGVWRATFVSNVMLGLVAAPSAALLLEGTDWGRVWAPLLCGVIFVLGQLTTMLAFSRGDVSMATPLMGIKSVFVAGFSALLLSERVPLAWWIAAAVSAAAVALIGRQGGERPALAAHREALVAVLASMMIFALNDVLIQKWTAGLGAPRFLSFMFTVVAVGSAAFVPFFSGRLRRIDAAGWRAVLPGAGAMALNHVCIGATLAVFGAATAVNVVYSSRGLIALALVWWAGHWFANEERSRGREVMGRRLVGALLLLGAIVLVITTSSKGRS